MGTTPTDVDYLAGQPGPGYGDSIGGMTIAGGILGALFAGNARVRRCHSTCPCSASACGP